MPEEKIKQKLGKKSVEFMFIHLANRFGLTSPWYLLRKIYTRCVESNNFNFSGRSL